MSACQLRWTDRPMVGNSQRRQLNSATAQGTSVACCAKCARPASLARPTRTNACLAHRPARVDATQRQGCATLAEETLQATNAKNVERGSP